jgi:hypothetical protein
MLCLVVFGVVLLSGSNDDVNNEDCEQIPVQEKIMVEIISVALRKAVL